VDTRTSTIEYIRMTPESLTEKQLKCLAGGRPFQSLLSIRLSRCFRARIFATPKSLLKFKTKVLLSLSYCELNLRRAPRLLRLASGLRRLHRRS